MTTGIGLKKWEVGQTVEVQSRTWAGINREGGCGRIIKIHYSEDGVYVEALDVKYIVSGMTDKNIDPAIVSPFETLERGGRKRRGRDFLMDMVKEGEPLRQREGDENMKPPPSKKKTSGNGKKDKNKKKSSSAIYKHQSTKVTGTTKKQQHSSSSKGSRNIHPSAAVAAAAARQGEADISVLSATTESSSHTTPQNRMKVFAATTTTTTKANRVKPVPAFVIADREVQVSPLPTHDRLMATKKNKKNTNNNNDISSPTTTSSSNKPPPGNVTAARRGLFGSSGNNKNNNSTVAAATAARAKSQAPRIQHNHEMKSTSKDTGTAIPSSSKANPAPPPPPVVSTPPKSSKVLSTKVKRAPAAQLASNDGVMIAQKLTKKKKNLNINYKNQSNDNDKPILELPRPRQRTTGDTNANNNDNKSGKTKSLKEVHEDCVKKASNFCNDVIYPSSSIGATAAKENNKNRSVTATAKKKKPPPCLPRKNDEQEEEKQRRLAIFRILRTKAEDGMIEESDFRKVVNSTGDTPPFSDDEINQHLEKLYKDEKIMRSDGTLYIID